MIRLRRDDFDDPHELAKYAATCGMNLQDFRKRFENVVKSELPPLQLEGMPKVDTGAPEKAASAASGAPKKA
jgi:6-phosphofructokinase 1